MYYIYIYVAICPQDTFSTNAFKPLLSGALPDSFTKCQQTPT